MDLVRKRELTRLRRVRLEQRKKEQGYKAFSIYLNPENTAFLNEVKKELLDSDKPSTNSHAIEHIFNIAKSNR